MTIPGIGPLSAAGIYAEFGDLSSLICLLKCCLLPVLSQVTINPAPQNTVDIWSKEDHLI